jgi:hypothetical protein
VSIIKRGSMCDFRLCVLFLAERPSIANPYGRANVDEEVNGVVREKLRRKRAIGGWLLRLVLHFY